MSGEKMPSPNSDRGGLEKKKKPLKPKDIELWLSSKPMTAREVLEEMKKHGGRPLTLEELEALIKQSEEGRIEPQEDDIVLDAEASTEDQKKLPE